MSVVGELNSSFRLNNELGFYNCNYSEGFMLYINNQQYFPLWSCISILVHKYFTSSFWIESSKPIL